MARCSAMTLVLVVVACGPESDAGLVPATVCGQVSPVRVLELPGDRVAYRSVEIGDRVYYVVGDRLDPAAMADDPGAVGAVPNPSVVSAGPCGESPRTIATKGVDWVFAEDRFPGVVFGVDLAGSHDVSVLDAAGVAEPAPFARDAPPFATWTEFGIFGVKPDAADPAAPAELVYIPYPQPLDAGPRTHEILADDVSTAYPSWVSRATHGYFVDQSARLRSVGWGDRLVTDVAADAASFGVSLDERFVAWRDHVDDGTSSPAHLLDTGTGTLIDLPPISAFGLQFGEHSLAIKTDPSSGSFARIIDLPDLVGHDVTVPFAPLTSLPDGRWIGHGEEALAVYDPATAAVRDLFAEPQAWGSLPDDEALLVYEGTSGVLDAIHDESKLWRVPLDGTSPTLLARRATFGARLLDDEGVMTLLDIDTRGLGDLVAIEAGSLDEQLLDERVYADGFLRTTSVDPTAVAYVVSDAERSGVWLAKLVAR